MAKKHTKQGANAANNWGSSQAGKSARPGFGGQDTRMFSSTKPKGMSGLLDKDKAPGISLSGN